ncbi:hypothetical protein GCM10017600_48620 [Streptosporangium carneum]|uniref:Uncharacterized protein n=2 Tax=Streptosporangium carneum TaxID=47481 RepID=A0A9W6MEX7_9ACTN|nr:hypothetical protein GCM10017600_48620 [Streptosporangium carneum]
MAVIVALSALCVGGSVVVAAPFVSWVLTYGCDADDDRLAASLATLGILDVRPADATPQEGRSSTCENDSRVTTVGQAYRVSGSQADVLSFYRDAAIKDGWTPSPESEGKGMDCFTKSVGGRDVELSVWFLDVLGEEEHRDDYVVDVTSSLQGGGWC